MSSSVIRSKCENRFRLAFIRDNKSHGLFRQNPAVTEIGIVSSHLFF
jgi:hypothetical protein